MTREAAKALVAAFVEWNSEETAPGHERSTANIRRARENLETALMLAVPPEANE